MYGEKILKLIKSQNPHKIAFKLLRFIGFTLLLVLKCDNFEHLEKQRREVTSELYLHKCGWCWSTHYIPHFPYPSESFSSRSWYDNRVATHVMNSELSLCCVRSRRRRSTGNARERKADFFKRCFWFSPLLNLNEWTCVGISTKTELKPDSLPILKPYFAVVNELS